jgi:hypothetical protein
MRSVLKQSTSAEECPPPFGLCTDFRAKAYLLCKNVNGALTVRSPQCAIPHMVNVGSTAATSILHLGEFLSPTCVSHQNRSDVSLWEGKAERA